MDRTLKIEVNLAVVARSKWYEYLVRFVFGGAVTVAAGVIAKRYGPEIGGLFLAFPAIFPATATLLEKHETQSEHSKLRARKVAGIDAAGASIGSIGLMVFALVIWQGLERYPLILVLGLATVLWLVVATVAWWSRKTLLIKLRRAVRGRSTRSLVVRR